MIFELSLVFKKLLPISVLSLEADVFTKKTPYTYFLYHTYLATIHEFYGRLSEEEINMGIILPQYTEHVR